MDKACWGAGTIARQRVGTLVGQNTMAQQRIECARPVEEQGELPVVWRCEWRLVSKQEPDLFTFTINGTGKSANEVKVG